MTPPDPLAEESLALAGISSASILGRIALGRRAGARVWRLGHDPEAAWVASTGPRQAHLDGFDLHANVWVPATNRARLEELCRYLLRPPVAQARLRLTGDGRIRLRLKTPWADGTRHLLFEPVEFLEKLAALIPRSLVNLVLYHGVLASHARWRRRVVLPARSGPSAPGLASAPDAPDGSP
ncbi:MAG: transposase, partial [Candidatus Rokuibacteriota bacterium]